MRAAKFGILFITCIFLLTHFCVSCTPGQSQSAPTLNATAVSETRPELVKYFNGYTGTFVLYDMNANKYLRYNPERAAQRFLPASTYKIMNAMIGLETGVIPDEDYVIKWDGTHYDVAAWNQDQTFKSAFQNSVVWYFQELTRRVGKEKEQYYVDAVRYGNRDISGNLNSFWLDGGLRISADEQVDFLTHLYQNQLPFSDRSMALVKEMMVLEKTDAYQLSGKTGSVQRATPNIAWFVGYLELNNDVYFFATNIESPDQMKSVSGEIAEQITITILQNLGYLPE